MLPRDNHLLLRMWHCGTAPAKGRGGQSLLSLYRIRMWKVRILWRKIQGSHCVQKREYRAVAESARSAKPNGWGPIIKASDERALKRNVELRLCT